jgi:hypothetical protein
MKSINTEEFFKLIATESGLDPGTVSRVYFSMIKIICRELRGKQIVKLPDWGEYCLKVLASHRKFILSGFGEGSFKVIPPLTLLKFKPDYKVKKYFRDFGKEGTMIK